MVTSQAKNILNQPRKPMMAALQVDSIWRPVRNPRLQGPAQVAWLKEEFARRRGGRGRCCEMVAVVQASSSGTFRCFKTNQGLKMCFQSFLHLCWPSVGRICSFFRWSHELWSAAYRLGRWPYRCCHGRFAGAATTTLCVTWRGWGREAKENRKFNVKNTVGMKKDRLNGEADAVVCFCADVNFSSEDG